MNTQRRTPPASACALLRCLCPKRNKEAITGDLMEQFREGRSASWFWRQVLSAILMGRLSQLRRASAEICLAWVGTALIWFFPWGKVFPLMEIITSLNWGARLEWEFLMQTVTALLILPLFAVLLWIRRTFSWANLVQLFLICFTTFTLGDFPLLCWNVSHPEGISRSNAYWFTPLMLAWTFIEFLPPMWLARRLPSRVKTIRA